MAREAALQVLYAVDVSSAITPETVDAVYDDVLREFDLPTRARERALEIVRGVAKDLAGIDERIAAVSTRWKMHRLAAVDRNVLRIGAWELLCEGTTPAEVVIDEAVEIARRYSAEESPAFVNGVLDALAKERPGLAT
jgi:N utilization substance protein B